MQRPDVAHWSLAAFWRTSATYRVRVALRLKDLAVAEKIVDLDAGEQHDPAFLRSNPMAAIPALFLGNDQPPLTQSLAILEYLDEVAPQPPLMPATPIDRARVRSIALMLAADTHPFIVPRVRRRLVAQFGADDAGWRAWQTHWLSTGLQAVEKRLASEAGTGRFCHGDTVTLADICLASLAVVTRVFRITVPDIPTISRIFAECEAMPAFAESDPMRQPGAPTG
ncbi:maleylacetoacetate isomerase [Rhizosaccharibacter radicis]|uniref:Maleylacetoacetate isomerase n=1 Tax=Rhizosaccharibacter radicis TaxID=2782605 RepID=A0ABT1VYW7_9PROT|nr:maleylacetoacetate isomerase [Acetobacteraceae bacterium KSS12]